LVGNDSRKKRTKVKQEARRRRKLRQLSQIYEDTRVNAASNEAAINAVLTEATNFSFWFGRWLVFKHQRSSIAKDAGGSVRPDA